MDWNERYSIDEYLFGRDPAQALVRHEEHLVSNGTTLVIADGEGRNSVYLAKQGFKVTATDSSIVAHKKAKSLAVSENVRVNYKLEDLFDINWTEKSYDNVVGICFQFVPRNLIESVLLGLRTATKKGGTLLIHGYTPRQLEYGTGGPKDRSLMYTKNTFTNLFHESEIFKLEEYEATINEGMGHNGRSAMIDFIGKF
tara:strand:- start:718 stop:1311 length:594 start_codon:yes stop_codon:yes gene_type:complete